MIFKNQGLSSFVNSDHTVLCFEIERWESRHVRANEWLSHIWVILKFDIQSEDTGLVKYFNQLLYGAFSDVEISRDRATHHAVKIAHVRSVLFFEILKRVHTRFNFGERHLRNLAHRKIRTLGLLVLIKRIEVVSLALMQILVNIDFSLDIWHHIITLMALLEVCTYLSVRLGNLYDSLLIYIDLLHSLGI